jgi:hypothetical protein
MKRSSQPFSLLVTGASGDDPSGIGTFLGSRGFRKASLFARIRGMHHIEGCDRNQAQLLPAQVDDYVARCVRTHGGDNMWTETTRRQYWREDLRYASDMTDADGR